MLSTKEHEISKLSGEAKDFLINSENKGKYGTGKAERKRVKKIDGEGLRADNHREEALEK